MLGDVYEDKDMVDVVTVTGAPYGRVPKSWLGTSLLPAGVKQGAVKRD